MEQGDLERKIRVLHRIKPRQEWVFLLEQRLEEEAKNTDFSLQKRPFYSILGDLGRFVFGYLERPAFLMPVLTVLVVAGAVWQGSVNSFPGDALYGVKTAVEGVPLRLSSAEDRPFRQIELAQKSLEELKRVAQDNRIRNLPSAIEIFENKVSVVSESVSEIVENQPDKALQASRGIVQLQKEKQEVERILGTKIGEDQTKELQDATRKLVEYEFLDLESRSLNEEEQQLLDEAKQDVENEDYSAALEKVWKIENEDIHIEG